MVIAILCLHLYLKKIGPSQTIIKIQVEIAEISLGLTDNMDTANHNIRS